MSPEEKVTWLECPTCGWALSGGEGSPCTNIRCASHGVPEPEVDNEISTEGGRIPNLDIRKEPERFYNRVARRGNAVGRGRKVVPTFVQPKHETDELEQMLIRLKEMPEGVERAKLIRVVNEEAARRQKADADERAVQARHKAKAQKRRAAARRARKAGRK